MKEVQSCSRDLNTYYNLIRVAQLHIQQSGVLFGFFSCAAKKTIMAARFFSWAALGWAVQNFFVQFCLSFTSPHSASHAHAVILMLYCNSLFNVWLLGRCSYVLFKTLS